MVIYRGSKETADYAYFVSLAQELHGIEFAYTDTAEYIVGKAELPRDRLAVHRSTDTSMSVLFTGKSYLEMRDFIIREALQGVLVETPRLNDLIKDSHFPAIRILCEEAESCLPYVMLLNNSNHHAHKLIKMYKVLSKNEYISDNTTDARAKNPNISIVDARKGHLHEHAFKGEFTAEGIEAFIEKYFHNRKYAHHYSEHPDDHLHKITKSITGHNYNREILNTKKGIVLLVHNGGEADKSLVDSFERAADWFHSKKIGKYIKFRILNQANNLTPLPFYEKSVLLMIRQNTQHDPAGHVAHEIKGHKITRKGLFHLMHNHGSYALDEITGYSQHVHHHAERHIEIPEETDL